MSKLHARKIHILPGLKQKPIEQGCGNSKILFVPVPPQEPFQTGGRNTLRKCMKMKEIAHTFANRLSISIWINVCSSNVCLFGDFVADNLYR
uniref:Uncharacterized protein n=1 Tax=Meloidogyne enterolobii TaxID=390850 RepID=A0A6V7VT25_MELEN|nr:unnamed protein product [Meloidogyne enterolobii]